MNTLSECSHRLLRLDEIQLHEKRNIIIPLRNISNIINDPLKFCGPISSAALCFWQQLHLIRPARDKHVPLHVQHFNQKTGGLSVSKRPSLKKSDF